MLNHKPIKVLQPGSLSQAGSHGCAEFASEAGCWLKTVRSEESVYTMSQKKTVQISFWQNLVKFPPILVIFGRKIVKRLKLYEVHSLSTAPNSRHHTTVLNADVPNCYTTLKVVIFNKLSNDLISTQ